MKHFQNQTNNTIQIHIVQTQNISHLLETSNIAKKNRYNYE